MSKKALFWPKRLDIGMGGFANAKVIRDHNKRKAFEQMEPERYGFLPTGPCMRFHC